MPYESSSAASDVSLAPVGSRIIRAMQLSAARGKTAECVANHSSRVEPADACFRDCIGAAWQPLTVAPMLRPRRAMCVRHRLLPVIRAKVGKHWIARPRLMLCLWKQRCFTSTPTSICTDSRTAPAMQRSRARRRDECSSSRAGTSLSTRLRPTTAVNTRRVLSERRRRFPQVLQDDEGGLRRETHRTAISGDTSRDRPAAWEGHGR